MGSKIVQELHSKQTSSGIKQTTKQIQDQTGAMGRLNATQDKHEKGASSMGKNSTANFAKMSQGLGGLVHVYATVAANVFALSSAFLVLKNATDIDIMVKAADQLSTSTGISYGNVAKSMKKVTQGALSMQEALRSASIGVSSGLSGKQMEDIAKIATKAANALGRSVPDAINRMTQAVVKNEPELVDEFGIILRIDSAMKEYALTLGKTKSELTSFDKQMAIHAQLIKQGEAKFGDVEAQVNAYNKLGATFAEMTHSLISFINKGLEPLANLLSENQGLLAGIAAIFAKGVFNKAIPELKNMTANMAEQRKEYSKLISIKANDLDLLKKSTEDFSIEKSLISVDDKDLRKLNLDMARKMTFEGLDDTVKDKLQSGLKAGLKNPEKYIPRSFLDNLEESVRAARFDKDPAVRAAAEEELRIQGLTRKEADFYLRTRELLTKEIKKSSLAKTDELSLTRKLKQAAQERLLIAEKQRLMVKDARSGAFSAGATGGFLGGGLASANKSIAEGGKNFNIIQKSGIRVAGVFGNISGILGGIMSLISGWGIALFAVSMAITPIADAFGLSSKAARQAQDDFEDAGTSLKKLQETSEKIKGKEIQDMQGYVDNLAASANNLNEQMSKVMEQFDALGELGKVGLLDKLFNWDSTDAEKAINKITQNIIELHSAQGLDAPEGLKKQVEAVQKLTVPISFYKNKVTEIKKELDRTNISEEYRLRLNDKQKSLGKKLLDLEKEYTKAKSETVKEVNKHNQAQRDQEALAKKALAAVETLAKLRAEERSKFTKSSRYYEEIQSLETINKLIKESGVESIAVTKEAEKYANSLGKSKLSNEDFAKSMKEQLENTRKLSIISLQTKTREVEIQADMLILEEKISKGSKVALLEKISLNKEILDTKIKLLQSEIIIQSLLIKENTSEQDKLNISLTIANIIANIAALSTKTEIANRALLKTYNDQTAALGRKLSILNSEKSIIDSQLELAKRAGDLTLQYTLERAKASKEIAIVEMEIAKLNEASKTNSIDKAKNDAAILALKQKQLNIEKLSTLEFGKQAEIIAKIKKDAATKQDISKIGTAFFDKKALDLQMQIDMIESKSGRLTNTAKTELDILNKTLALTKEKYKWELNSAKVAVTAAVAKRKEVKDIAKNDTEIKNNTKNILAVREAELAVMEAQNNVIQLRINQEEMLYEAQLKSHDLAKQQTNAATIFEDPKGFTDLLGKEFAILSKEFSDSIMNPIDRAADSMLRVMDTATDTLYDAIASGENIGVAMRDALIQVTDDITREITTDIMKQWNRDLMRNLFGIESDQAKQLRYTEEIARNTAKSAGVVPEKETKDKEPTTMVDRIKTFFSGIFGGTEEAIDKGTEVSKDIAKQKSEEFKAANEDLKATNKTNAENIATTADSRHTESISVLNAIYQELVTQTSKMCACAIPQPIEEEKGLSIGGFETIGTDLSQSVLSIEDKAVELAKPVASPSDILTSTAETVNIIKTTSGAALTAADTVFLKSTAIDREQSNIFNAHKTATDYSNDIGNMTLEELQKITRNTTPVAGVGEITGDINSFDVLNTMGNEQVGLQTDMVSNIMSGNSVMEDGIMTATQDSFNLGNIFQQGNNGIIDSLNSLASSGGIGSTIGSAVGGKYGGLVGSLVDLGMSFFANGGITNSLTRYAKGGVTDGAEIAMIGDNASGTEAVVPMPDGETIPVEFTGDEAGGDTIINTTINISGTDTNNAEAVRRSAGQVALAASNSLSRARNRNG